MEFSEYSERQRQITQRISDLILRFFWPFRGVVITERVWYSLLRELFPHVEKARRESAILGREFYDSQREKYVGTERWPVNLAGYRYEWFVEAMEPAKKAMSRQETTDADIAKAIMRAAKEVENGGRKTILRPVKDPDVSMRDKQLKGWARVATGRETCGFCLMLVSRGPVYLEAETAGLDLDDTTALELIEEGDTEALNEASLRWHPGCDCKVVPVFDRKSWPGRDAYLEAEELWKKATRGFRGKDALNALRRALESGEVDPQDFAAAA